MNVNKVLNVAEDVLIVGGMTISLSMIQTILGIAILVIQLGLIITKIVLKVVKKVKNKDIDGAIATIEEGQKEIDDRLGKK